MSTVHRCRPVYLACVAALTGTGSAQSPSDLRRADALAVSDLQPKIDAAIERGVAWLLDQQQRDGSWFAHSDRFAGGQTALSAYTLLKAGLPAAHPAVRRALAHLTTVQPRRAYVAAAMLLALAESGELEHRPQMERIVTDLLAWQRGSWPYPLLPGETGLHAEQDLSITQFALLGLRAATHAGIKVPAAAWQDALRTVLRYQEKARTVEVESGKVEIAGFRYHLLSPGPSTGSMTTAGLASLVMARQGLGRVPGELAAAVDTALARGTAWLVANYDVRDNPAFSGQRWVYYLYGLERASALLQTAYWGEHAWYLEGARVLLEKQGRNGAWSYPEGESDTCFAILFLERATAPTTGKTARGPRTVVSDDPGTDVAFKVVGHDDGSAQTLLVTRIAAGDGTRAYLIDTVEYLVDDAVVAAVAGHGRPWTPASDFRARWQPACRGTFAVGVRVTGRRADSAGLPAGDPVTLHARIAEVAIKDALEPWMLPTATWQARNQIAAHEVVAAASSTLDGGRAADRAADGVEGSAWVCAKDDPAPRLTLTFAKPVAARTLVLTQANGARGWLRQFDLVRKVRVIVNGSKAAITADLVADELAPTRIDLGKVVRVRRLDIAVVERGGGSAHPGAAGFAEVALEK